MSRVANSPVEIPKGVETNVSDTEILVKGSKGNLRLELHNSVAVARDGEILSISAKDGSRQANAMAGTFRSLINNMMQGVSVGFVKKLELQGVGYRAKAEGKKINITVGYSHPINYQLPEGVSADTPSQTEIMILFSIVVLTPHVEGHPG